jgi:hypothetical protein
MIGDRLPVQIEIDKGEQNKGRMHVVAHDLKYLDSRRLYLPA